MLDTGEHGSKPWSFRETVAEKSVTDYGPPFSREIYKALVYMDINRHGWSPKDPVPDEIIEVSGANSPLVAELCGREFTRRDPAAYRLAGDLAESGNIVDGEEFLGCG